MVTKRLLFLILNLALSFASGRNPANATELSLYDKNGQLLSNQELAKIESKMEQQDTLLIDPTLAKKADEKHYSIQIKSFTSVDSYNPDIVDITQSYLGIVLGKDSFPKFLNEFRETKKHTTVVQLSAKISLTPLLLRGSIQDRTDTWIDTRARELTNQYVAATAAKIHQQIGSLIQANVLTPEDGQLIEAKFISSAKSFIDSRIAQLQEEQKKEVDQRLDKIASDYTLEEFALKIGHQALQTEEGALLIFGQVGKAAIDAGLTAGSGMNSLTPLIWWGTRGMTTSTTGLVHMGLEWITKNNTKVGLESYFFHDRYLNTSGRHLINQLVYMTPSDFSQDQKFWKINANLQRFYVKLPSKIAKSEDQFYLATGNSDGRQSLAAGALTRIMPKFSIEVDMAFNRPQFDYAVTESLMFHATNRLVFYFVNDNSGNLQSNYASDAPAKDMSIGAAGLGATFQLVNVLIVGVRTTVDINAECKYFYKNVSSSLEDKFGCGGGMMINAQY